ncbi:hypothetical protein EUGRSUZ_G00695 [Eucalyptus grandis]|uniref:Uncharacterized protein n=2 Tax=Eucalyptus grandis TaxID=71139 RepID=A0A059BB26_EUCGR|nr:hypothetical protein EUGRSUZ_G00695 [Eucalyptus grandis]
MSATLNTYVCTPLIFFKIFLTRVHFVSYLVSSYFGYAFSFAYLILLLYLRYFDITLIMYLLTEECSGARFDAVLTSSFS